MSAPSPYPTIVSGASDNAGSVRMSSVLGAPPNPLTVMVVLALGGFAVGRLWLWLRHRSLDRDLLRRTASDLADRGAENVMIRYGRFGKDEVRFSSTALSRPLPSTTDHSVADVIELAAWRKAAQGRRPRVGRR
jgi:hypothetical protein